MEEKTAKDVTSTTSRASSSRVFSSWLQVATDLEERVLEIHGPLKVQARAIRAQPPVDWKAYLEADLITHSDYVFITSYQDTNTKEERDAVLQRFKDKILTSFIRVVQSVCIVDEIKKFLVLLDDMLQEDWSRIGYFRQGTTEPWLPFMDLLRCSDEFVRNISSLIIARFLRVTTRQRDYAPDLRQYFQWLKGELRRDNVYLLSVLGCLQMLLQVGQFKRVFWSINGIFRITRMLDGKLRPQAQYQLVFCLWLASFDHVIAGKMTRLNVVPVLMEVLKGAPSEIIKLQRVTVATLRNLLEMPRDEETRKENAHLMIENKIFRFLEIMRKRNIEDLEYLEDSKTIETLLTNFVAEMSTFDSYRMEVHSRSLEWSVVHTSRRFWEENAERLNEDGHDLLKILLSLLESPETCDPIVSCIAIHDLRQYMKHYPRGRHNVQAMGGKEALVRLLAFDHPQVRYQALKSLQILMLNTDNLLKEYISDSQFDNFMEWRKKDGENER